MFFQAGELRGKTKSEHMQISRMRTELMDENDYYGNENELQEMEIELEELGLTPTASSGKLELHICLRMFMSL